MEIQEPTSIKALFQSMVPENMAIVRGEVLSASPLRIQVVNDKLILTANLLCVPRHLTDYAVTCDISLAGGTLNSRTGDSGAHPHGPGGGHAQAEGSGVHSHPDSEGRHAHPLETFGVTGANITIHSALKPGETVFLLSFNGGKKYYILDREGSPWASSSPFSLTT